MLILGKGFDAWGEGPNASSARTAGFNWRTWYSSHDPSKDAPAGGVARWAAAGGWSLVNYETTISRTVTGGYAGGKSDMQHAIAEYKPQGMPDGASVLLSADESIPTSSFAAVLSYFQGANSVKGPYRVGVYGEQALIAYLKQKGAITVGWRSMSTAFPGGSSTASCDLVQTGGGRIGGVSVDFNYALSDNVGAWKPNQLLVPGAPPPVPAPKPVAAPVHDAAWRAAHNTFTPLTTDGRFGPATVKAVQFVTGGVTVDGAWGPASKISLQKHLGVSADGVVGPGTIRALQKRVGATADGVWGSGTTGALQRALNAGRF